MIRFDSVSYIYAAGKAALSEVSLEVSSNELLAIAGPNGAGKTTLVKHVNGLLKPTKGTVTVFGLNTRKSTAAKLSRRVGIVFQNPDNQLFSQTVEDELRFALRNFGFKPEIVDQRVNWALRLFDLEIHRKQSPFTLSGGEKKRLCLASVLAWDPEVLILDEPTIGQDARHKEILTQTIRMLLAQNKIIILVSHDLEFIWPLQPRLAVLDSGKMAFDGPISDFFRHGVDDHHHNLLTPQLVQLWDALKVRPEQPFRDVFAAKEWILGKMEAVRDGSPQ